jgi:predicted DNA-binding transcriptional regulator YafY
MSKREALARYNLIINKLRRQQVSSAEILAYLDEKSVDDGYNYSISKRTLQRDIDEIRSLFNIDIQYNKSENIYFIYDEGDSEASERILEAFDTFNALQMSERVSEYIHFEKRKPQGTQNLYGLLHAIKNRLAINFTYHKFWDSNFTKRTAEPYALKEYRSRWYLIANDRKDNNIKSFALDRLYDLDVVKQRFQFPTGFNVNEHFEHCFGIISPNDEKPQEVVLSFTPFQGKYIKTLPLHASQQVLADNETELRIKLTLFLTHDFLMELLSFGKELKVVSPQKLIDDLKSAYQGALDKYN